MADDVLAFTFDRGVLFQNCVAGRRENTVEAAQNGERQDDLTVFIRETPR